MHAINQLRLLLLPSARLAFVSAVFSAVLLYAAAAGAPPAVAAPAAVTVDGQRAEGEGYVNVAQQNTQTDFGNNDDGTTFGANGSELDAAWVTSDDTTLYLLLSGNLQTNYNKLEIFFDTIADAGQNRLRGDNADIDFNGLNRMGDDGSGNGLTFDAGFAPDRFITLTTGDSGGGNIQLCFAVATLATTGGGPGSFETCQAGQNAGVTPAVGPSGIVVALNNSNTGGVAGGSGAAGAADVLGVTTGVELAIPLSWLGVDARAAVGDVRVAAFVNGGGHDFVSNQVLGGIGGGGNLGEPRSVNFANVTGEQFFSLATVPTAVTLRAGGSAAGVPADGAWVLPLLLLLAALTLRRAGWRRS